MTSEKRDDENARCDEKEDIRFLKTMMPFVKQVQSRKKLNLRNDLNKLVQSYVYPDPPSVKAEKRKRKSAFVGDCESLQLKQELKYLDVSNSLRYLPSLDSVPLASTGIPTDRNYLSLNPAFQLPQPQNMINFPSTSNRMEDNRGRSTLSAVTSTHKEQLTPIKEELPLNLKKNRDNNLEIIEILDD